MATLDTWTRLWARMTLVGDFDKLNELIGILGHLGIFLDTLKSLGHVVTSWTRLTCLSLRYVPWSSPLMLIHIMCTHHIYMPSGCSMVSLRASELTLSFPGTRHGAWDWMLMEWCIMWSLCMHEDIFPSQVLYFDKW